MCFGKQRIKDYLTSSHCWDWLEYILQRTFKVNKPRVVRRKEKYYTAEAMKCFPGCRTSLQWMGSRCTAALSRCLATRWRWAQGHGGLRWNRLPLTWHSAKVGPQPGYRRCCKAAFFFFFFRFKNPTALFHREYTNNSRANSAACFENSVRVGPIKRQHEDCKGIAQGLPLHFLICDF